MIESLIPGARAVVTNYPMTMPGTYPIGREGVIGEPKGEGYFEVRLKDNNLPFCDGKILAHGTELMVLPVTSPCAPSAPSSGPEGGVPELIGVPS